MLNTILQREGYQRTVEVSNAMLSNHQALMDFNTKDFTYIHVDKSLIIELHISLFHVDLLPVPLDQFYNNRTEILIGGEPIPVMSKQDHLLYLLLHGSVSVWHRSEWLLDIPLISNNGADYMDNVLYSNSERLGVQRVVLQGLALANRLLDMPISQEVAHDLKSHRVAKMNMCGALNVMLREKSLQDSNGLKFVVFRSYTCFLYWPTMRPELRFKLACIDIFFISLQDYQLFPLSPYLRWLYYSLRPVLWLIRSIK